MRREVVKRVLSEAEYVLSTGATVRECGRRFGVGKTTVHKDLRERLPLLNPAAARQVDAIFRKNLSERHLRGGRATRLKYMGNKRRLE